MNDGETSNDLLISLDVIGLGEERNSSSEFPRVKNAKMKSFCDSREVSARSRCRCSSPQRWSKATANTPDPSSTPSCCILSVKNVDKLANEMADGVRISCADSNHCTVARNGLSRLSDLDAQCRSCNNGLDKEEEEVIPPSEIRYVGYGSEHQMPDIMRLIQKDLSEPYSIYTYRYFIHNWPHLCFLALDGEACVGAIVCKLDMNKNVVRRGYIAMLAVDEKYRKQKIGSNLVLKAIQAMIADDADEVVLETEITNKPALRLYENLGFVRDKRLFRYYLNGVDALRLKLWLR